MKIIKGAESSHINWTVRKLVELMKDGTISFLSGKIGINLFPFF